jgi:hypothetical protein
MVGGAFSLSLSLSPSLPLSPYLCAPRKRMCVRGVNSNKTKRLAILIVQRQGGWKDELFFISIFLVGGKTEMECTEAMELTENRKGMRKKNNKKSTILNKADPDPRKSTRHHTKV